MLAQTQTMEAVPDRSRIKPDLVRDRIRERMTSLGLSGNSLSRRAGLGVSYVNDLLKGHFERPAPAKVDMLAEALACDPAYLIGEQDSPRVGGSTNAATAFLAMPSLKRTNIEAARVPMFASPWTDSEGYFQMGEAPEETTPLPFEPVTGAYALMVPDDLMAPRYTTGEKVFVNPRRPVQPGSYAVIRLTDGRALIRRIASLDQSSLELEAIATGDKTTLSRDKIGTVHRIIASGEA